MLFCFFFSSRRRHTRSYGDWSSDVCSSDLKAVNVSGQWGGGAQAMTKDERGVWSVTVGPIEPELYEYNFTIDGFQTLDPGNAVVKPSRTPRTSLLEVPGNPPRLSEFQNVPHGTVRIHWYQSRSLGRRRGLYVYT